MEMQTLKDTHTGISFKSTFQQIKQINVAYHIYSEFAI